MTGRGEKIKEILLMNPEDISRDIEPYVLDYFKSYLGNEGANDYLRRCEHIAEKIDVDGKVILDVGCGFGLFDIYLALEGAKLVIGVDMEKNRAFEKTRRILGVENVASLKGVANALMLADNSVDVAMATDAISHINDTKGLFEEVFRVLKPGGAFTIEDASGANKKFIQYLEPTYANARAKYRKKRKGMINTWFPDLPEEKLDHVTDMTKGIWGEEIKKAVKDYIETGKINETGEDDIRDPENGYWVEKLWDPYYLKAMLEECGFRTVRIKAFDYRLLYKSGRSGVKGLFHRFIHALPTSFALRKLPIMEIKATK